MALRLIIQLDGIIYSMSKNRSSIQYSIISSVCIINPPITKAFLQISADSTVIVQTIVGLVFAQSFCESYITSLDSTIEMGDELCQEINNAGSCDSLIGNPIMDHFYLKNEEILYKVEMLLERGSIFGTLPNYGYLRKTIRNKI